MTTCGLAEKDGRGTKLVRMTETTLRWHRTIIGFGKKLEHNLALLAGIATLCRLGRPVLIGASRKRFIGELTGQSEPAGRVFGSVAASLAAYRRGATLFRMHDVGALASALAIEDAINRSGPKK